MNLGLPTERPARVLCIGAHADDIEIGCGGTVLQLLDGGSSMAVHWVVFSAAGARAGEARDAAGRFLEGASAVDVVLHEFRDGFFPYQGGAIKEAFEALKSDFDPDIVFTHYRRDFHQDHRLLSELTLNTFRDHTLLEYEIPKYDGDLTTPNVYVPISEENRDRKVAILIDAFASQREKRWFSPETFSGLMRLRGIECASPTGYAEGFHARKLVVSA